MNSRTLADTRPHTTTRPSNTSNTSSAQPRPRACASPGLFGDEKATSPFLVVRSFLNAYAALPASERDEGAGRLLLSADLDVEVTVHGFRMLTSVLAPAAAVGSPPTRAMLEEHADWWLAQLP
ncbi:hypothetical protein [Leifsonia poae]|uniref:hypothetical protein n=1 Tax=Leifsonia poae TaxID=110933 RepID=UPI001CBEBEF6|nr:hypothetical protein [Leifsonia poae]